MVMVTNMGTHIYHLVPSFMNSKWVFHIKCNADGSVEHYKA